MLYLFVVLSAFAVIASVIAAVNYTRAAKENTKATMVHYHAYEMSNDDKHLKKLLDEGRFIVRLEDWNKGAIPNASVMYLSPWRFHERRYYHMGIGERLEFEGASYPEEQFIAFCTYKKLRYLDMGEIIKEEQIGKQDE